MKSNIVQILTTVLSNFAVLAGLVFLIFELRQNSSIALSQMTQERALSNIDQHASYAADEHFSELYARVFSRFEFDSVSKEEWDRIARYEEAQRTSSRDIYFQSSRGLIDESLAEAALDTAARHLPLQKWLRVAPNETGPLYKILSKRVEEEDFEPTTRGRPFMAKFLEWSKDKKSPYEI